jgi:hypothetical protein
MIRLTCRRTMVDDRAVGRWWELHGWFFFGCHVVRSFGCRLGVLVYVRRFDRVFLLFSSFETYCHLAYCLAVAYVLS